MKLMHFRIYFYMSVPNDGTRSYTLDSLDCLVIGGNDQIRKCLPHLKQH